MKKALIPIIALCYFSSHAQSYTTTTTYRTTTYTNITKTRFKEIISNQAEPFKYNYTLKQNGKMDLTVIKTPLDRQLSVDEKLNQINSNYNYRSNDSQNSIDRKLDDISNQNQEIIFNQQDYLQEEISKARTPKTIITNSAPYWTDDYKKVEVTPIKKRKTEISRTAKIICYVVIFGAALWGLSQVSKQSNATTY